MSIKDIIKRHKQEIQHFRKLLFPLMHFNVITGFNIYDNRTKPETKFILDYLHSELEEDREHRQELEDRIRKYFDSISLQKLEFEKINRHTSYKLKKGWEAARLNNETIIGVAFQNDLEIGINNKRDLLHILEIFRKYFNYYKIDKMTGKYVTSDKGNKLRNKNRATDSWEVPLIVVKTSEPELMQSYPQISEFQIMRERYFIDTLVGNREKTLSKLLDNAGLKYNTELVFANKVFVDWINQGIYSRRYKEFLREFNAAQKQI